MTNSQLCTNLEALLDAIRECRASKSAEIRDRAHGMRAMADFLREMLVSRLMTKKNA